MNPQFNEEPISKLAGLPLSRHARVGGHPGAPYTAGLLASLALLAFNALRAFVRLAPE